MWADETYAVAASDHGPLIRARQAASLAGIGRAVYDALLERIIEIDDRREITARHREHLKSIIAEHGQTAAGLDLAALEADIGALPPKLVAVVTATRDWIVAGLESPEGLFDVYMAAEARKGARARLAPTPNGRARRLEWSSEEHGLAAPLHYRWQQVSTLLNDLANAE
jgi:hypothetical protein